jgi:hypothetical protein
MSTPWCPRKCSSLLPRTPSAFQHASRRSPPFVCLGRAVIFGYEKNDGFQHSSGSSCPYGKFRKGCEKPMSQLHTSIKWEVIEEISDLFDGRLVGCGGLGVLSRALSSVDLLSGTVCWSPLRGPNFRRKLFFFWPPLQNRARDPQLEVWPVWELFWVVVWEQP